MKKAITHKLRFVTIIKWLVLFILTAVLMWYLYLFTGRQLCRIALNQIGELTGTRINSGSINYHADGSVFINDLVVKPPKNRDPNTEIIRARKVFARFDKKSLLLLKPKLETIDVNDFVFNAAYDIDTGWSNLSDLAIKPSAKKGFHKIPNINLESGILQYIKISEGQEEVAMSVPIEADFKSDEQTPQKYNFNITTATMLSGFGNSHLSGSWSPGDVIISGGIASLNVPNFEMSWVIDVLAAEMKYDKNNDYTLALSAKNVQFLRSGRKENLELEIPSFIEKHSLFTAFQSILDTYQPKGLMDINLETAGNLNRMTESDVKGSIICRDAAFNYSDFKYPIEHLTGKIVFTRNKLSFNNLKGKHKKSEFTFDGWYKNDEQGHEYGIAISSDKMPLDKDLYNALDDGEQKFWTSFSPEGNITVDLEIKHELNKDRYFNLKVGLLDVDAVCRYFAYPLKNLTGRLVFTHNNIIVQNVDSQNSDTQIVLNGIIHNHWKENPVFDIAIDVNNIPLDSTLEAALQESRRKLYKKLNPSGQADGLILVSMADSGDLDFTADLSLKETTLKLDSFPEPVTDVISHTVFTPDLIVIKDFTGRYGDIPLSLSGQVMPDSEQQVCYDISLDFDKVQVNNKKLAALLPKSMANMTNQFDPNGSLNVIAELKKDSPSKPADYNLIVNCLGNSVNLTGFPYPMTDVTGTMKIDSGNIKLENISAFLNDCSTSKSEKAKIDLNGNIKIADGAMDSSELDLSAKNVCLNERFSKLLPEHCRGIYSALAPAGCVDVDFKNFHIYDGNDGRKTVAFDGTVSLERCDFKISNEPAKLDSVLQVHGKYVSGKGFVDCSALVDKGTLNVLGKTLTDLQTEFGYDPNQQTWSSDYLIAQTYGGKTTGQLEFIQKEGQPMKYVLQTVFENVDLKEFMADTKLAGSQNNTYTTGKMSGSLDLSSQISENKSRIGACRVTIKDMQVGKMSPLANLLQVLNLNEPCDYAFDSMFIDSYIRRDGLVVQKLDMSGKSVAFYGSGSINLSNGGVDLSLTARGHRLATDDPSIWQSLTEGLGQAVVRMDVTGDYRNIKVATRALPVLEGTLNLLGSKPVRTN